MEGKAMDGLFKSEAIREAYCREVGADRYTPDAASCADAAAEFCSMRCA